MRCRGKNTRRDIINNYVLRPVTHVQLLAGQEKSSCAGAKLTDAYYCFHYKSRTTTDEGTILCGDHVAKDFLELINHPRLPLFNPLHVLGGGGGAGAGGGVEGVQIIWNATARQLHDAINLLVICWSTRPRPALCSIKAKLERAPGNVPLPGLVRGVNTIVGLDVKKRTLSQMIDELALKNPTMRQYHFNLLDDILAAENVVSNFA